jgi:hypothetical protein
VTTVPPAASEPYVMEERPRPTESKYQEKLPYWLIILVASILAIAIIWIMLIVIYPSMALS